ncbi:MAG: C39 family peptidase [Candidatus Peregrinibacteria bacterium]
MKNRNKFILLIILVIIILFLTAGVALAPKIQKYLRTREIENENTKTLEEITDENIIEPGTVQKVEKKTATPLPEKAYLEVQFICQAPLETEENWTHHEESCEEAAALMAFDYETGKSVTKEEANEEILSMIEWQKKYFGAHKDLYSDEMKEFLVNYYDLQDTEVTIIKNASINDIKLQIANGHPVIVPVTSSLLSNPYYPYPGYHMLIAIGYTKDKIITNDNGTRRGKDFSYDTTEFEAAMKDAGGNVLVIKSDQNLNTDL